MSKISDVYGMARGWMKHDILKVAEYNKPMAWCWLIENAAWKDHSKTWRHDRPPVTIKRGQLLAAIRVMADEWAWSKDRVDRFLKILKNAGMIDVKTETGICVITICNYDDYQLTPGYSKDADKDAGKDTGKDADEDADKDNKNKVNKVNKGKNKDNKNTPTPQGGDDVLPMDLPKGEKPTRFEEFWKHYPRKEAKKQAMIAYTAALKRIGEHELIHAVKVMRSRFDNDDRDLTEKLKYCKYAQGWLNGERYLDYIGADIEDDDDEIPDLKKMTPDEHAAWVLRRAGIH